MRVSRGLYFMRLVPGDQVTEKTIALE